jgi:uncharacterized protein YndB with AHSA1/START domain
MKVEKSIKIAAAPAIIWSFLVDPEKIPMWFDTLKKCEYTSEKHTGVGTTYYVEEKVPGPLRKVNFKATTWDENENLTLEMTSGKNVTSYEIRWHLKAETSGTVFHFFEKVGMPFGPVGKILGKIGQRKADRMVEGMLFKLKNLSESK